MAGGVQEVTGAEFEAEVLKAGLPVMVDFSGPNWPACRAIGPIVEELAGSYSGRIKVVEVNAPENIRLLQTYRVQAMPTLLFFKEGQPQASLVGKQPREAIEEKLKALL